MITVRQQYYGWVIEDDGAPLIVLESDDEARSLLEALRKLEAAGVRWLPPLGSLRPSEEGRNLGEAGTAP